eukprot:TRINITY_DN84205_c0_g1_i1.p2 TRINITY_DN84205_c0_g1~~TRINITY_DN84205_c0_g1_i1.p2  ORF type:complete len:102 (+),score=51.35 TRINITY_DN84205_c0_g1_i1:328-633(+)
MNNRYSPWIVALTDGADGSSAPNAAKVVERRLKITAVNLAIITVGRLDATTINQVRRFVAAAKIGDNIGEHILAEDTNAITKSFERVGALMDSGATVAEFL